MAWIAVLLCAFVLGSIPFGYLIGRAQGIDIRTVGSGNVGATNVIRALGKKWGILVFVLDVAKGFVPAFIAQRWLEMPGFLNSPQEWAFIAGFSAVLGHCFSPFLGFRGGKGIATGLGAVFGTSPLVAGPVFGVFLLMLLLTRYVSLSSLIASASMLFWGWLNSDPVTLLTAYAILFLFVLFRHRSNIAKLLDGTERKFSFKPGSTSKPESKAVPIKEPAAKC